MKNDEVSTEEGYTSIDTVQAYEWVKNGVWDLKTFQIWIGYCIKAEREESRLEGYDLGYDEGYEYGTGRPRWRNKYK